MLNVLGKAFLALLKTSLSALAFALERISRGCCESARASACNQSPLRPQKGDVIRWQWRIANQLITPLSLATCGGRRKRSICRDAAPLARPPLHPFEAAQISCARTGFQADWRRTRLMLLMARHLQPQLRRLQRRVPRSGRAMDLLFSQQRGATNIKECFKGQNV
jgi:hypothetical protein